MTTIDTAAVLVVTLLLAVWQSYKRGKKFGRDEGINASLDHLIEEGHLDVLDAIEAEDKI